MTAASAKAFTESLPLFGAPQAWQTSIYNQRLLARLLEAEAKQFRKDFPAWLHDNFHVWEAFENQADMIWARGRRHYSARTIGEYLRHESALRETAAGTGWKLNDHYWPDLARLYMLVKPERDGFFERRVSPATLRAA